MGSELVLTYSKNPFGYVSVAKFFQQLKSDKPEPLKKQSNWQRKHEEFIVTIRAAKGLNQFLKDGGPLPPPPPPSYDPGKKKKN
ncbi:hypothetical protein cypCar_00045468 [Cyprinus carpio]|nr:hypothetical protein cypCar_00045468 [Cyprinus carpio]